MSGNKSKMNQQGKGGKEEGKSSIVPFDDIKTKTGQEILDLFEVVFKDQLQSEQLYDQIQLIKQQLYERNYLEAFGDGTRNKFYMARWSPSRALAYASIFSYLEEVYHLLTSIKTSEDNLVNCLSIGGGAGGEFVGIASVFSRMMENSANIGSKKVKVNIVDISDWHDGLKDIFGYIDTNWLVGSSDLSYTFDKRDILQMGVEELGLASQNFITSLFTTNELFRENKVEAIRFLQKLNKYCIKGCYFLIVESAGSFSHIDIGSKTFPIQFLIDTILTGKPGEDGSWELINRDDSCWFRIEKHLNYSMKLENMRFFYRLYRKC
ncbi:25S rRNA (uracil2843-N3)-methyltransferase [Saccharomycopsis crataegensis]|uniref:25S rRNA (Uracil2843-N3)-methyltransferase n=1 Tax=Saccharomycopsis crataegensis TaxID=43959 RepID=A0AAV5QIU8_9ASCO|nr:25S rRNA (uracil2843-N3)-methyltransferase [Saccharomycopsis crataegensis]